MLTIIAALLAGAVVGRVTAALAGETMISSYWIFVIACLWLLDRTVGVTITETWRSVLAEKRRIREEERARHALEGDV